MSLRDLKTDLKSLKYGHDRPGGGDSGQPYQKVDINTVDSGFNKLRMIKFDDGLIRGGAVGAINSAVVDTLRIGKFLVDLPKGPLFIVKQVGLQLSNPQLETKKITIGNGRGILGFIGKALSPVNNTLGPTRIYNLGINTIAQVPVGAFGVHFNRHGLLPVQDDSTKYLAVAEDNNKDSQNNRLVGYKNQFRLGDFQANQNQNQNIRIPGFVNKLSNIARSLGLSQPNNDPAKDPTLGTINKYIGGPSSVYGIGNTFIQRYSFTENSDKIKFAKQQSKNVAGNSYLSKRPIEINSNVNLYPITANYTGSVFLASKLFSGELNTDANLRSTLKDSVASISDKDKPKAENKLKSANRSADQGLSNLGDDISQANARLSSTPKNVIVYKGTTNTEKYKELRKVIEDRQKNQQLYTVTNISNRRPDIQTNIERLSTTTAVDKYGLPNPARVEMTATGSRDGKTMEDRTKNTTQSKIQPFLNYNSSKDTTKQVITVNYSRPDKDFKYVSASLATQFKRTNDLDVNEDKLALVFTPLDPFTGNPLNTLKFLGYLTDYNESYNSTWDPVKYAGRAESFYIFKEFKRDITVAFNIPCFNTKELDDKHCALSELASTLAGKYNSNNLLGGIITKLKVGNYVNNQPGIINSLTFKPLEGSSWDLDKGLAFYLSVNIGFTLIHNFLPQHYKCGFINKEPDAVNPTVTPTRDVVVTPPVTPTPTPTPPSINNIDSTLVANNEAARRKAETLAKSNPPKNPNQSLTKAEKDLLKNSRG